MKAVKKYWRRLRAIMVRDSMPPERVAAGWALGMFVGCAVPFGFQLIISVPLALAFKISKIGATVGTLITNPVTIFIIYPIQTWAVNRMFFCGSLSLEHLMNMQWTWQSVRNLGIDAVLSFFIGGLILAFILAPITYFAVRGIVVKYRSRRRKER